ncbi:hypothetical protein C5167_044612, partial [Papaver somniferum]
MKLVANEDSGDLDTNKKKLSMKFGKVSESMAEKGDDLQMDLLFGKVDGTMIGQRGMSVSKESSSSRKVMKTPHNAYFTEDIWLQIFPYFPSNVIFKFKCVSQQWKFNLSSP